MCVCVCVRALVSDASGICVDWPQSKDAVNKRRQKSKNEANKHNKYKKGKDQGQREVTAWSNSGKQA